MALLLTFFILLLSFSTVDTQKYKTIVDAMGKTFGTVIEMENITSGAKDAYIKLDANQELDGNKLKKLNRVNQIDINYDRLMDKIHNSFSKEITSGAIEIITQDLNIIIRFPEETTFSSGSSELSDNFESISDRLRTILSDAPGQIVISGHTDNQPINTFRFHSNWELSSARAASMLYAIINNSKLDPHRFTVQGHADTMPAEPNTSPANRAVNRRVEIVILDAGKEKLK